LPTDPCSARAKAQSGSDLGGVEGAESGRQRAVRNEHPMRQRRRALLWRGRFRGRSWTRRRLLCAGRRPREQGNGKRDEREEAALQRGRGRGGARKRERAIRGPHSPAFLHGACPARKRVSQRRGLMRCGFAGDGQQIALCPDVTQRHTDAFQALGRLRRGTVSRAPSASDRVLMLLVRNLRATHRSVALEVLSNAYALLVVLPRAPRARRTC